MEAFLSNPETWVGIGILIFLALVVWKKVPAFIARALDTRASQIAKELDDVRALREEAEALLAQYQRRQSEAEREAEAIVAEARAEAERYAREARAAIDAQVERRAKIAQEKIAQAEAQALADVRATAADAAVAAAGKIIAERLSDTEAAKLIQDSIKSLPGKLN